MMMVSCFAKFKGTSFLRYSWTVRRRTTRRELQTELMPQLQQLHVLCKLLLFVVVAVKLSCLSASVVVASTFCWISLLQLLQLQLQSPSQPFPAVWSVVVVVVSTLFVLLLHLFAAFRVCRCKNASCGFRCVYVYVLPSESDREGRQCVYECGLQKKKLFLCVCVCENCTANCLHHPIKCI